MTMAIVPQILSGAEALSLPSYCPKCASPLTTVHDGGRDRPACSAEDCRFVHFGDFSIGCAGVVTREVDGELQALLVQRAQDPFAGAWQIPGGYAEHDELVSTAVEREVHEESGIVATVSDVVAFRHALAGNMGGPSTNIYMIFRLDYQSGDTQADGVEIANAGFFTMAQMSDMKGVQGLSRWGIEQTLNSQRGTGLSVDRTDNRSEVPGWQLFGLTS